MTEPLETGAIIGILGGGQLGRMLSVAASRLGLRTHIFEPAKSPPAAHVADMLTTASYEDYPALKAFAKSVSVVTYEFENIPIETFNCLEEYAPIRPRQEALRISQDRLFEKAYLNELGLETASYADVETIKDLEMALSNIGTPSILKTRRFGYDGKGQIPISETSNSREVLEKLAGQKSILEGFVNFSHEVSIIGARSTLGNISCFDPGENLHRNGILHSTTVPARLSKTQRTDAILIIAKIMNALEYIGVMCVELFVTPSGLIVNEIAPRVHNSGHWTQNGCAIDQFEQHIRAIAGWPIGDGSRHNDILMENLIGKDIDKIGRHALEKNVALHVYGKCDVKPGRKMGHINRIRSMM